MSLVCVVPGPSDVRRRIIRCPSHACRRRRRHIVLCQKWYDPIVTCCACGFTRGMADHYRKQNSRRAAKARAQWAGLDS